MSRRVTLAVLAASVTQASAVAYQCKNDAECEPHKEQGFEKCGDGGTCIGKDSNSRLPKIATLPEPGCPVDQPTEKEKCDGPQDYACEYKFCSFACIPSDGDGDGRFWRARCTGIDIELVEVPVEPWVKPTVVELDVKPTVFEPDVKPTVVEPDVKPAVVEPDVTPTVVEDVKPTPSKKAPECTPGCKPRPRLMGDDRRHLLFSAMPTPDNCPAGCVPDG